MGNDDLYDLKIQFYVVSAILAFFVVVLIAVVIELHVRIRKIKTGEESDDESVENSARPPPPQVNSSFAFPKPNPSKSWRDSEVDIRKKNVQQEFNIPKPSLSNSWQVFPGENERNKTKRNFGNDLRPEDDMSSYSFEGRKSPSFMNSNSSFRNPLSGNNDNGQNYNENRPERQASRQPNFNRMSSNGNNFNSGDNFGFRRDQRNNNFY